MKKKLLLPIVAMALFLCVFGLCQVLVESEFSINAWTKTPLHEATLGDIVTIAWICYMLSIFAKSDSK